MRRESDDVRLSAAICNKFTFHWNDFNVLKTKFLPKAEFNRIAML